MDDLPFEVLTHVLFFIGKGHHRYISTVSTKLQEAYSIVSNHSSSHSSQHHHPNNNNNNVTNMKSVISSPACIEIYLEEGQGNLDSKLIAILKAAARYGHIHVLKWAYYEAGCAYAHASSECIFISAIEHGQMEATKWLHAYYYGRRLAGDKYYDHAKKPCEAAAKNGQLHILQWLRANDFPWNARTCEEAAKGGHLNVLQWLKDNDCPWHAGTCEAAAASGHLEIVQWLRANGCPWNTWTCEAAAKSGQLHILKWARIQQCPWDSWTCYAAASAGHLDVLKWARMNGCPWREETCYAAVSGRHLNVLRWAIDNGCPYTALTLKDAAKEAVTIGDISCLCWLKELGCHFDKDIHRCAANNGECERGEVLEWLRLNNGRRVHNNTCYNWMRNIFCLPVHFNAFYYNPD